MKIANKNYNHIIRICVYFNNKNNFCWFQNKFHRWVFETWKKWI